MQHLTTAENGFQEYASSGITGFISLSGTLINWFDEIFASFNLVYGRRISNEPVEGINSRIDKILSNACGYQNFARMRNRLVYSLNKSDYSQGTAPPIA